MNAPTETTPVAVEAAGEVASVLKLDLPDVFAYASDRTKAKLPARKNAANGENDESTPAQTRGEVLLVESDQEVARLVARLLQQEGYEVTKTSCLAEAHAMLKSSQAELLLARRESVPQNLETELLLQEIRARVDVRVVDNFSKLILGQVMDYESMAQGLLGTLDLLMALLEGANSTCRGHAHNVAKYCRLVGQRLGMARRDLDCLTIAAYMHDVGYLAAPPPAAAEQKPEEGLRLPSFRPTLDLVANLQFAHEVKALLSLASWHSDPKGAASNHVPEAVALGARILRVVDVYDTVYRRNPDPQCQDELFDWMRENSPALFDSGVLETLIQIRKHERVISAMDIFWAEVLWVDPRVGDASALQLRMENEDLHVVIAKSVQEALDYLRRKPVALVLTEHRFAGKEDGFALLYAIKNDPSLNHIPVVFYADAEMPDIRQGLELGAEDWLPKAFNVEIVVMKLKRILNRAQAVPTPNTDGVQGNVRDIGMIELVQILSSANRSVRIVIESADRRAELVMQHGKVVSALLGDLKGEDAAIEMLLLEDGRFRILPLKEPPVSNVTMSTDNLVMQSCFRKDLRANGA